MFEASHNVEMNCGRVVASCEAFEKARHAERCEQEEAGRILTVSGPEVDELAKRISEFNAVSTALREVRQRAAWDPDAQPRLPELDLRLCAANEQIHVKKRWLALDLPYFEAWFSLCIL